VEAWKETWKEVRIGDPVVANPEKVENEFLVTGVST